MQTDASKLGEIVKVTVWYIIARGKKKKSANPITKMTTTIGHTHNVVIALLLRSLW